MFANRNGFYYTLDRTTGQVIVAKPFVKTTWAKEIGTDGRPILLPGTRRTRRAQITCPDITGGTNFWPPAYDPIDADCSSSTRARCARPSTPGSRTTSRAIASPAAPLSAPQRPESPATARCARSIRPPATQVGVQVPEPVDGRTADDRVQPDLQRRRRRQSAGARFAQRQAALALSDGRNLHGTSPITYMLDGRQHVLVPAGTTLTAWALPQ